MAIKAIIAYKFLGVFAKVGQIVTIGSSTQACWTPVLLILAVKV